MRSLTDMLRQNAASSELKSMLASFCLRRSKQAIGIPSRRDIIHKVDFEAAEASHYNRINHRITVSLKQQASQIDLKSYSNILAKINSLRQVCNLGTCYQGKLGGAEDQTALMQEVFDEMSSAGTAVCCKCKIDLSEMDEENEVQSGRTNGFESPKTRIATCGELICPSCFANAGTGTCPSDGRCQFQSFCELFIVESSYSSGLTANQLASRLPTKMRALQEDLLALPETDKR